MAANFITETTTGCAPSCATCSTAELVSLVLVGLLDSDGDDSDGGDAFQPRFKRVSSRVEPEVFYNTKIDPAIFNTKGNLYSKMMDPENFYSKGSLYSKMMDMENFHSKGNLYSKMDPEIFYNKGNLYLLEMALESDDDEESGAYFNSFPQTGPPSEIEITAEEFDFHLELESGDGDDDDDDDGIGACFIPKTERSWEKLFLHAGVALESEGGDCGRAVDWSTAFNAFPIVAIASEDHLLELAASDSEDDGDDGSDACFDSFPKRASQSFEDVCPVELPLECKMDEDSFYDMSGAESFLTDYLVNYQESLDQVEFDDDDHHPPTAPAFSEVTKPATSPEHAYVHSAFPEAVMAPAPAEHAAAPSASPERAMAPSASPERAMAPSASPERAMAPSASPEHAMDPSASPEHAIEQSAEHAFVHSAFPEAVMAPAPAEHAMAPPASPEHAMATSASPERAIEQSACPEQAKAPPASPEQTMAPASPEQTTVARAACPEAPRLPAGTTYTPEEFFGLFARRSTPLTLCQHTNGANSAPTEEWRVSPCAECAITTAIFSEGRHDAQQQTDDARTSGEQRAPRGRSPGARSRSPPHARACRSRSRSRSRARASLELFNTFFSEVIAQMKVEAQRAKQHAEEERYTTYTPEEFFELFRSLEAMASEERSVRSRSPPRAAPERRHSWKSIRKMNKAAWPRRNR